MGKISFKFRQWWSELLSFLRVRRFEGVITNAREEDIANSSIKSSEEALEFLGKEFQWRNEKAQQDLSTDSEEGIETIDAEGVTSDSSIPMIKSNLSKIQVGMIWYADNTCSFEQISGKKVKAVIELIEGNTIFGDWTANEASYITESTLVWGAIQKYIKNLCARECNIKVVWYNKKQLEKVYKTYDVVRKTFEILGKKCRRGWYWSSTKEYFGEGVQCLNFDNGEHWFDSKFNKNYVRPVLALSLDDNQGIECIPMIKSNLSKIQVGMIWYEDDTASFERISTKKVKAVIELINGKKIYGDLTASELQDIQEKELNWYDAKKYINNFSYSCQKNERIVWYDVEQLKKICVTYDIVRKTFEILRKKGRARGYWTSSNSPYREEAAWIVSCCIKDSIYYDKSELKYFRPVLELKLQ